MPLQSLRALTPKRRRPDTEHPPIRVTEVVNRAAHTRIARFILSTELLEETGLTPGDRVDIRVDHLSGRFQIVKDTNGWKIGRYNGGGVVQFTLRTEMKIVIPEGGWTATGYTMIRNGISFLAPSLLQ